MNFKKPLDLTKLLYTLYIVRYLQNTVRIQAVTRCSKFRVIYPPGKGRGVTGFVLFEFQRQKSYQTKQKSEGSKREHIIACMHVYVYNVFFLHNAPFLQVSGSAPAIQLFHPTQIVIVGTLILHSHPSAQFTVKQTDVSYSDIITRLCDTPKGLNATCDVMCRNSVVWLHPRTGKHPFFMVLFFV